MIAFVRGPVAAIGVDSCVVEVGGVGLLLHCHPGTLAGLRPGQETTLHTSMVVREDSLTLYAFADDDERTLFELLQTASGVGPRLAQAALAVLSPDQIRHAVATEDRRRPAARGGRRGLEGPGARRPGRPRLVRSRRRGGGDSGRAAGCSGHRPVRPRAAARRPAHAVEGVRPR